MPMGDPWSGAPVVRAVSQYLVRSKFETFQAPAYLRRLVQVMPQYLEGAI